MSRTNQAAYACKTLACTLFIVTGLSACGGGGGGDPASPSPTTTTAATPTAPTAPTAPTTPTTPPTTPAGNLLISEVATNVYTSDVAWLEVYNPNATAVALSDYTLRSGYIDPTTAAASVTPTSFTLPAVNVPAKGYLVIAGKVYDKLQDNAQIVYVKNGNNVPYWNASGSVELVTAGQTADFVRFGTSTTAPTTASHWTGANVAALPSGANEHGKSIVRLASGGLADTNTAADWTLVNFATPAGPNDIAAGVIDTDLDGIPDSAKISGGSYAGLDLYAMGARPGRRDIFMEIDYMTGADPALTPRQEALQKVVDAFAAKNIAVHLDTGPLYSATFNPAQFNLGGGNAVSYAACIELATSSASATAGCTSFYDYKSLNFDVRRKLAFHYALFANSRNVDGSAGSSGVAEVSGNDLIVTLGGYGFTTTAGTALNQLINAQASTLMHEFGHNLGLLHGGNEAANYKPNHYSIMNYMYQFAGLSTTPNTVNAAERYYLANSLKGKTYCNLVENSPCGNTFYISYSDGSSADLDENNLSEAANIGRGSVAGAYADWDGSNALTAGPLAVNLNPKWDGTKSILKDYNEWANLTLPFARGRNGSNSGSTLSTTVPTPRVNPMNERPAKVVAEEPLPAALQHALRNGRGTVR